MEASGHIGCGGKVFVLHVGRTERRGQIHATLIIIHHTAWDLMKKHPSITRGEVWSK